MRRLALVLFLALMLTALSCTTPLSQPDADASATETSTESPPIITETATPSATPVPPTMTPSITPSPSPSAMPSTPTAASETTPTPSPTAGATLTPVPYGFQVSYTLDASDDANPPEGKRWLVVVTAIQNNGAAPITIEQQSLALVDQDGERYTPDEPTEETQPPLVGAYLEAGEDILGLVRFTIPDDAEVTTLEWCPQGSIPCSQPLTAAIP